jgi:C-terminal processing protease CtpA/Prc
MILEPASTLAQPFDRAFAGISLRASGPDYRTFRVREVLEDSPAAEAGIVADDVIEAIDDTTADRLTLSAITELLEKPARYRLTIRRGERIIETTLAPKRLI